MPDDISPFADFLAQRREEIIAEWLRAIGVRVSVLKKDPDSIESCTESLSMSLTAMTALMKQLLEFATLEDERPRLERAGTLFTPRARRWSFATEG